MKVRLRVLHGSHRGKMISVPGPHFFIGRGENCHLRAQSDLISRRHCALIIGEKDVKIRDLRSKNGTLVNGEFISGDVELKMGDKLKVGPLEFEVVVDHTLGGSKRKKVEGVKEAMARHAAKASEGSAVRDDLDVASWLEEADESERLLRTLEPETRQFMLDETEQITLDEAAKKDTQADVQVEEQQEQASEQEKDKKKKKEPKKLPRQKTQTKDTQEAASETLKKLFSRR